MTIGNQNIAFIGFGEAAQAFTKGWRDEGVSVDVIAFDVKTNGAQAQAKEAEYAGFDVVGAQTTSAVCSGVAGIFSLVTAEQAETAAHAAAQSDLRRALFLDCNSCAPETKRRSSKMIDAAGGRYVDVAVMTPVHPKLHRAPCLLAGPHAQAALELFDQFGMVAEIAGDEVGAASTRKMIRSVMIKGLEALTLECFLAARKAGVDNHILASLEQSFPGFDWARRAPYMMERSVTHGIRRAAEMDEVAQTLRDLGIEPHMTQGTVVRQRETGGLGLDISSEQAQDLEALSDAILAKLT
ncbi:MAG: DUF1932 domain-containing protein [Pseudomonadota bacterium]